MKYILLLVLFFSSFCYHTLAVSNEQKQNTVVNIAILPNDKSAIIYKKYIISAYNEIGYRIIFQEMVALRAVKMMEAGQIDALLIMVDEYAANFPILMAVPVTLAQGELLLICQEELVCNASVLQNKNNLVGTTKTSFATQYLKDNTEIFIYEISTRNTLGKMLTKNRLDYISMLSNKQYGNFAQIDVNNFSTFTLTTVSASHYIHKKHQKILPQLTQAMKNAMKKFNID